MKLKSLIFCVVMLLNSSYFGQIASVEVSTDPIHYTLVDEKPVYPGGNEMFWKKIIDNYELTDVNEGEIIVSFHIEKCGTMTNFKVEKDLGSRSGKQLIKILKTLKKWQPAIHNSQVTTVKYQIKVNVVS